MNILWNLCWVLNYLRPIFYLLKASAITETSTTRIYWVDYELPTAHLLPINVTLEGNESGWVRDANVQPSYTYVYTAYAQIHYVYQKNP